MIAAKRSPRLAAVLAACATMAFAASPPPAPVVGTLSIETEPAQASVSVDRIARGSAPLNVSLPPGDHYVEVRAEGYDTDRRSVRIVEGETATLSVKLPRTTGIVLFSSEPPGAEVTIDGVSYGHSPCLVADLPLGSYQATFTLGGYRSSTVPFALRDRVPVRASAELASDTATLEITTAVDDAEVEVRVNGVPRGVAPCVVDRIPAGDVVIEARAEGYKDFTQMTRLGEAETLKVDIRLDIRPASLKVVSIPDKSRVYFDNAFKGETPILLEDVAPGEHRVRVEREGHDPMARAVTLGRGQEAIEEFRLKSNTGAISVTTEPEGVQVFIDGVKVGETPPSSKNGISEQLEIPGIAAGTHKLKFSKPGYGDKVGDCEIVRGETFQVPRVVLKRRFIPDYEVVTATGVHRGVLDSIAGGVIRIETSPGVFATYNLSDVQSHGKIQ